MRLENNATRLYYYIPFTSLLSCAIGQSALFFFTLFSDKLSHEHRDQTGRTFMQGINGFVVLPAVAYNSTHYINESTRLRVSAGFRACWERASEIELNVAVEIKVQ